MECSVCHVRSMVNYCKECERMLCEVCGVPCSRCKKFLCRAHRSTTPGGRNLCPECMADREAKRARQAKENAEAKAGGGSSFQDLMEEFDDELIPGQKAPVAEDEEPPADYRPDWAGEAPPEPAPKDDRPKTIEDQLNARVLTGSTPPPRPMWIGAIIAAGMAWLLIFLVAQTSAFRAILQPWMSYTAMLVALGAIVWAIAGYRDRETLLFRRRLCGIGFLLGVGALGVAWWMRHP